MRRPAAFLALCASLVLSTQALAAELPQRWVSAGGALSEWITALGGEARLVGVDTTSQHPASLKALPSVGYQRQLSAEGILSLRPDVLVKGGDYGIDQVVGADIVTAYGGTVKVLGLVENSSTTAIVEKIRKN